MNGKRILVVSDTHGSVAEVQKALEQTGPVDYLVHLGDYVRDAEKIETFCGCPVVGVKGNCDFTSAPTTQILTIQGQRLFLTHGHQYGVKYSTTRLAYAAEEAQAVAAFFGHTHLPTLEYNGGILLLNPGSLTEPRSKRRTFALVLVTMQGVFPKILELQL